jgi:hypothetical protein
MKIAEVSQKFAFSPDTLRNLERLGTQHTKLCLLITDVTIDIVELKEGNFERSGRMQVNDDMDKR